MQTPSVHRLALTGGLIGALVAPSAALAARQVSVVTAGATSTVTATFTAGEPLTARCSGGRLALAADLTTAVPCAQVARLVLEGSDAADAFDLAGLTGTAFPALARISATTRGGADSITGGPLAETIAAGPGDDVARGNGGADTITGGQGADDLRGGPGADAVDGGDGNDTLQGCGVADCSADGADAVTGGLGDDSARGGPGDDTIAGGGGNDRVRGEAGADVVRGDDGADLVDGDGPGLPSERDTIYGGAGGDTLLGTDADFASTGSGLDVGEHVVWRITRPWAGISPVVNGGGGTAELVIEPPGEWSFAPAYDAGGASVREVRADGTPRWVFDIDTISALAVRMSDGADRANVVVNGLLPFTVNGGAGTDRLSVGVPGGVPVTDTGSVITGAGFKPLTYGGFEQRGANWVATEG